MEKQTGSDLFANDGSFMERFNQLQKEKGTPAKTASEPETAKSSSSVGPRPVVVKPNVPASKRPLDSGAGNSKKTDGGKLAFSLKQKTKVAVAPVRFSVDDEEEEGTDVGREEPAKRPKTSQPIAPQPLIRQGDVAPSPPSDMIVKQVADKLANFVAKNGRQFEHMTRQKNPGDTPFKFLFDKNCPDYKYYEYQLLEEEKALAQTKETPNSESVNSSAASSRGSSSKGGSGSHRSSIHEKPNYQTPASALYGTYEGASQGSSSSNGDYSGPPPTDPVALMEFYMKKAAQEERKRPPRQSKDEMPPPPCLQAPGPPKTGHHMGDFIPPEELEKFLASCNDAEAQKYAKEAAEKAKIQADNIGHKLLSKMGWRDGEGLGSDNRGRADPVMAGDVKKDHLGVGAVKPGEVKPDDDIYEQYKKRMMLGYRYRPNPLNNPRKQYY